MLCRFNKKKKISLYSLGNNLYEYEQVCVGGGGGSEVTDVCVGGERDDRCVLRKGRHVLGEIGGLGGSQACI